MSKFNKGFSLILIGELEIAYSSVLLLRVKEMLKAYPEYCD